MKLIYKCLALILILQANIIVLTAEAEPSNKKNLIKRVSAQQDQTRGSGNNQEPSNNSPTNSSTNKSTPTPSTTNTNQAPSSSSSNTSTPAQVITSTNQAPTSSTNTQQVAATNKSSDNVSKISSNLANAKNLKAEQKEVSKLNSKPLESSTNIKPSISDIKDQANCYLNLNNYIFDLTPLSKMYDNNYSIKSSNDKTLNFDFCRDVIKCPKSNSLVAGEDCSKLAGSSSLDKTWTFEQIGETNKLILKLPDGENCSNVTYEITCKPEQVLDIINSGKIDVNQCGKTIKMESKYACPAGEFKPWHLNLKVGKIVVVIFLVLIGLFFLILGTKFSAFTLTIIFGACLSLLLYTLLKTTIKMHIGSYFIIGFLIAIMIPLIDDKDKSLHKFSSILILGFFGGTILYTAFVANIKINPDLLYWIFFVTVSIISLILWAIIGKHIISLCTSMVGAYLIVRAAGVHFDNYPDEIYVSNLIKNREHNQLKRKFSKIVIYYLIAMLLVCIIGTIIQGSFNKEEPKKKEEKTKKPIESNNPPPESTENNS